MNVWIHCYIEGDAMGWGIYYPDCTQAYHRLFKTKGWATRTLNILCKYDLY
jgi:hypothetical protein